MTTRSSTTKTLTDAEIEARDRTRGFTDADLAEVLDDPEWTDEQLREVKPFAEVFPELSASIGEDATAQGAEAGKDASARRRRR